MKAVGVALRSVLALVSLLGSVGTARADDVSDLEGLLSEQIVSSASKRSEGASSAPALSANLTAEDLRKYGIRTLAEAIDFLAIAVASSDNLGGGEIGARGVLLTAKDYPRARLITEGSVSVRAPGRDAPLTLRAGDHFRAAGSEPVLERVTPVNDAPRPAPAAGPAQSNPATASAPSAATVASGSSAPAATLDWEALYRERRYAASLTQAKEQGFERLLSTLPARKLADLADAARLGGDADLALRALGVVQRRFPGAREASDAEFLIGRVHAARGEAQPALARFEKYLQYGEQAPYAVEAMGRLVELYRARGQAERARAMAERYLARAPNGPYRRLCSSVLEKR